jgi:hypothetical protein
MQHERVVGYEKITGLSSVQSLTVPSGANMVRIDVEDQNVRWRSDGTDPDASTGGLMVAGSQYEHVGNLNDLRFIEVSASAVLSVTYYKRTA